MKKTVLTLALLGLLIGLAFPISALAQDAPNSCTIKTEAGMPVDCPGEGNECFYDENYKGGGVSNAHDAISGATCCFLNTISSATNWLFLIMMMLVVILIMWGGLLVITASGNEESVKKGRSYITYAIFGIVIGFLARAIPYIMRSIMGI